MQRSVVHLETLQFLLSLVIYCVINRIVVFLSGCGGVIISSFSDVLSDLNTRVTVMKVAIIGAGASGLTAIKSCLDEGLEPTCYERSEDIGGLWRYVEEVSDGQACVMRSTIINTSKEMMCFSDFPIPAEYPIYMHNTYMQKYFNLYADQFGLRKHIRFRHEIISLSQNDDFDRTGKWKLKIKDVQTQSIQDHVYDAVMICTGHHADKNMPDFPGMSDFKGKVLHSHDYRHSAGYEGKRVVVVGIGNSGGDVAVELSRVASQTFLSTRSGSWVVNRISEKGLPLDMSLRRRFTFVFRYLLGAERFDKMAKARLNKRFDHATYGLKPKHAVFSQHPTVNDDLPNRLASGTLRAKSNIKQFTEHGVVFDDGTTEDNIDIVILATGYVFGFPFLDEAVLKVAKNRVNLYKYEFLPNLKKQTLSIIGCIQPVGSLMPISELQSRLAARVFKGDVTLPLREEMWTDINAKADAMDRRYVTSLRHTIQVDWIQFMDELAALNKCLPNFKRMFLSDPKLAMSCIFGPCTPYQYRLTGPGKWEGARNAILTQWNRALFPLKTRPLGFEEKDEGFSNTYMMCFILILSLLFYYLSI